MAMQENPPIQRTNTASESSEARDRQLQALKPYQWKPGQSGNPKGRPKSKTLKEYVREMLERMTDEERDRFLVGMPKLEIWRMAEGAPSEDKNIKVSTPTPILGGLSQQNPQHVENKESGGSSAHEVDSTLALEAQSQSQTPPPPSRDKIVAGEKELKSTNFSENEFSLEKEIQAVGEANFPT